MANITPWEGWPFSDISRLGSYSFSTKFHSDTILDVQNSSGRSLMRLYESAPTFYADPTAADQGTATGSGNQTIKDFINTIGSSPAVIVLIPTGASNYTDYAVLTDLEIPSNILVHAHHGARFSIPTGVTLTINKQPKLGLYQVFSGDGSVNLPPMSEYFAEWFGALGDGVSDDAPAISKLFSSMPSGSLWRLLNRTYRIKTALSPTKRINIAGSAVSTEDHTAIIGSVILKDGDFTGVTLNDNSSEIHNLIIDGVSGNTGMGLHLLGNSQKLQNVTVCNQGGIGIQIGHDSVSGNRNHFQLINTTSRNNGSYGVYINDYDSGGGPNANGGSIVNLTCSFNGGDGLRVDNAQVNSFFGVSIEQNMGNGIHLGANAQSNAFFNPHSENNTDSEFLCDSGSANNLIIGSMNYSVADNGLNSVVRASGGSNQALRVSRRIIAGADTLRGTAISAGYGAEGTIPGVYLWETNADSNGKFWDIFVNNGILTIRLISDDGVTVNDIVKLYRSGTTGTGVKITEGKLLSVDGIGIGNSTEGDVTGTAKTRKIQVFDETGAGIGYIQIYQGS